MKPDLKPDERKLARDALLEIITEHRSLSHLKTTLTPFAQSLCFGVCRQYIRLDTLAKHLLKKPPKKQIIWVTLLLGLYQLRELNRPEYATVHETVALLDTPKTAWAKPLVNAVLRRYCREKEALNTELQHNPLYHTSYPRWLLKRIQKAWPNHWEDLIESSNMHPPMSLRVNARHTTTHAYQAQLQHDHITATPIPYTQQGLVLSTPTDVHTLPGFKAGDVSVQDGAAQLAVSLLALKPGLRLLDACAAPGGKTCHILETEPKLAACIALDSDSRRQKRTQENLTRLGLQAQVMTGNAEKPDTWWDGQPFDRILLDAPCSATGVIRRHPDIKLLRTPEDITAIVKLQALMLEALWPLLTPGGLLVYATCSILPEENEEQIARFMKLHADCMLPDEPAPFGHPTGHGLQILPGEHTMDGFFYSVLRKQSTLVL
jgi:16S rRNA (cytosine967-C5)-methyltransferase